MAKTLIVYLSSVNSSALLLIYHSQIVSVQVFEISSTEKLLPLELSVLGKR